MLTPSERAIATAEGRITPANLARLNRPPAQFTSSVSKLWLKRSGLEEPSEATWRSLALKTLIFDPSVDEAIAELIVCPVFAPEPLGYHQAETIDRAGRAWRSLTVYWPAADAAALPEAA